MTTTVLLATRNPGKVAELRRILSAYDVELLGLDAFPAVPEVAETGLTFVDNARLKAHEVSQATGLIAVADDSGLAVDALHEMPGVLSARWSGRHGDDAANLALSVLAQLAVVPDERRGAAFVCAAAAAAPDGREVIAEGRLEGALIRHPRGVNGFGYDPIFVPTGELPDDRRDARFRGQGRDQPPRQGVPCVGAELCGSLMCSDGHIRGRSPTAEAHVRLWSTPVAGAESRRPHAVQFRFDALSAQGRVDLSRNQEARRRSPG